VVALVACAAVGPSRAEDVEKKWRLSAAVGGFNSQDEVESASANIMSTLNTCIRTLTCPPGADTVVQAFRDPRNDSSVFGNLDINPGNIGTLAVQYGINKFFLVEGSVGYQKGDIGDVEVAVQLPGNGPVDPNIIPYNFIVQRIPVGELERVPIQLSALARFRPRATFNPYLGAGLGYSIIGFETDPALDALSVNMDASRGVQMRLEPFFINGLGGGEALLTDGLPQLDLQGATIDARDSFEWHLAGGAEFTFKRRWSAFLDLRWIDFSRSVSVSFNNSDELGNSVPNYQPYNDSPLVTERYGPSSIGSCSKNPSGPVDSQGNLIAPVVCTGGGLSDFGRVVVIPSPEAPGTTNCAQPSENASTNCILDFVFEPDGAPDPGWYYAQGGTVDYDGFQLQLGIRFSFGK
jgi:opacity protein-like surface antigen